MDPRRQSTVVEATQLDPTVGSSDRLLCERLHSADGLTLVRATVLGESRWSWQAFEDAGAFGYVARGTAALDPGDGVGRTDPITVGTDAFFHVPAGHSPTVRRTRDSGPLELLVGFEEAPKAEADSETDPKADAAIRDGGSVERSRGPSAAGVRVAERSDLVPAGELSSVTRETPFPDASVRMVRGHSDGQIVSEWHHHGDNHVFGYVLHGDGFVDWGTAEDERRFVGTEECFHIPAEFVHRDRSSSDGRQEYVLWLTGSDPRTVHVDSPTLGTA